jgi:hypothetical protein
MRLLLYFGLFTPWLAWSQTCDPELQLVHAELIPLSLEDKSTVGKDQALPVVQKIIELLKKRTDLEEVEVEVTAQSARLPFYKLLGGKNVIDPQSETRAEQLAQERSGFIQSAWQEKKFRPTHLKRLDFKTSGKLAGPPFKSIDLNGRMLKSMIPDQNVSERLVLKENPNYEAKIIQLYRQHQAMYLEEGLISSYSELMDEKRFDNYYLAKFKPFHGFRLSIHGKQKCDLKRFAPVPGGDASKQ